MGKSKKEREAMSAQEFEGLMHALLTLIANRKRLPASMQEMTNEGILKGVKHGLSLLEDCSDGEMRMKTEIMLRDIQSQIVGEMYGRDQKAGSLH